MEIFLDSSDARIWTDGQSPMLCYRVQLLPGCRQQVLAYCESLVDHIRQLKARKRGIVYSIIDFTAIDKVSVKEIRTFVNELISWQNKEGVNFIAIVVKDEIVDETKNELYSDESNVGVFGSFCAALARINRMREALLYNVTSNNRTGNVARFILKALFRSYKTSPVRKLVAVLFVSMMLGQACSHSVTCPTYSRNDQKLLERSEVTTTSAGHQGYTSVTNNF